MKVLTDNKPNKEQPPKQKSKQQAIAPVTMFKAPDGTLHDTLEKAEEHLRKTVVRDAVKGIVSNSKYIKEVAMVSIEKDVFNTFLDEIIAGFNERMPAIIAAYDTLKKKPKRKRAAKRAKNGQKPKPNTQPKAFSIEDDGNRLSKPKAAEPKKDDAPPFTPQAPFIDPLNDDDLKGK